MKRAITHRRQCFELKCQALFLFSVRVLMLCTSVRRLYTDSIFAAYPMFRFENRSIRTGLMTGTAAQCARKTLAAKQSELRALPRLVKSEWRADLGKSCCHSYLLATLRGASFFLMTAPTQDGAPSLQRLKISDDTLLIKNWENKCDICWKPLLFAQPSTEQYPS